MTGTGVTRRAACVIGWPARHSRSPKLHGWWLERYGIDGDYRAEEVSPHDFPAFVRDLASRGYVGANVTLDAISRPAATSAPT